MRGRSNPQISMLVTTSTDSYVPTSHPLREIKVLADEALKRMSRKLTAMYSRNGRPSIPPERLLKSQLLIALHSIRSDRQFCEQLRYNILFRWFLDLGLDEAIFDASTFSKNRERFSQHEIARRLFDEVVGLADEQGLLSHDHFSVDGTLLEANASLKSFRPKDSRSDDDHGDGSNPTVNFHGHKRSNKTHASTTDPESRLMRKGLGKEAKLSYGAHALMENRNGMLVDIEVTEAGTSKEWDAGIEMLARTVRSGSTVGGDKGYDLNRFVGPVREQGVTPHVAAKVRNGAIDARTTRHVGYEISQRIRKRIEEFFGWAKTIGGLRRTRFRGIRKTRHSVQLIATAFNLLRLPALAAAT